MRRNKHKAPICEDLPPTSLLPFPPAVGGTQASQHSILSFMDSQQLPQPTCEYQAAVPQGPAPSTPHTPAYAAYNSTWSQLSSASGAAGVPAYPVPSTPAPKADPLTLSTLSSCTSNQRTRSMCSSFTGTQQGNTAIGLHMDEVKPHELGLSISVVAQEPKGVESSKGVVERFKQFVRKELVRIACGAGNNQRDRVQHYKAM